ncbi:MAG: glycoside hydrolase family 5 protein [Trueperaceae bacterium]|nr:glycoside hydrolase family 5 protein [Trueperaceae bacterium]
MRKEPRRVAALAVAFSLAIALTLLVACAGQPLPPPGGGVPEPFGRGINFANALEAPNEGDWGVTLQEGYAEAVGSAGFQTVRLPIKWSAHASAAAPYTVDPDFFARVDEVVGWIVERGMNVIVDFHHYDELHEDPGGHTERWLAIWRQIAEHYRDAPDGVLFELLNEPHDALDDATWNALVSQALAVVRETNPTRWVVVGPTGFNGIGNLPGLAWPDDDRLVLTVHYYDPFYFTHQGAEWVEPAPPVGTTWTGSRLTPNPAWADWSWDTTRDYGDELTLTFDAGWAGYYLQPFGALLGYDRLAFTTSRAVELLVACGPEADNATVPVDTEAGVETVVDLAECGGAGGVERVILQNRTAVPQTPFVLQGLELRADGQRLPLLVTETEAVEAAFDFVREWAEAHGAPPVLVGEFGAYSKADMASRVRWTRAVRRAAEARGLNWAYWEFADGFGAYDPVAGVWRTGLLGALVGD